MFLHINIFIIIVNAIYINHKHLYYNILYYNYINLKGTNNDS